MIRYGLALGLLSLASLFWSRTPAEGWFFGICAGYLLTEMWKRRGELA